MEYYRKALDIAQDIGYKRLIASCQYNIASLYMDKAYYEDSLECFMKSLLIKQEIGAHKITAIDYLSIGVLKEKCDVRSA